MNKKYLFQKTALALIPILMTSCAVGPDYKKPVIPVPAKFKEASNKNWKVAKPQDNFDRGKWWEVFHDPQLNALENQLNISNQTIATAAANYQNALDLVDEARANYFPTLAATATVTRQRAGAGGGASGAFTSTSTPGSSTGTFVSSGSGSNSAVSTTHSILINATWEPDIWGLVRRTVEASAAGAQASGALLASTRLSSQASLAQFYFELRGLDRDQKILNDIVRDYKRAMKLTQNQYTAGVVSQADVIQAKTQLETAQVAAINNGIARAQYEHAIAVLIGKAPADFSLAANPNLVKPPRIPVEVPSALLERRPDVAQAERLAAQANAQIGVAIAAYFPTLTISGASSYQHRNWNNWFSVPGSGWSLGPQLAETIFDGGLRSATVAAARANFDSTVASYKQVVLTAFQNVEDNLVSVRILKQQAVVQNAAARDAMHALQLVINQYKAGTVPYSSVITAQVTAYTAEKNASDVVYLQMTSAVGLVKALGGGWDGQYTWTHDSGK